MVGQLQTVYTFQLDTQQPAASESDDSDDELDYNM